MSISSASSLQLALPHQQEALQSPPPCFSPYYRSCRPMENSRGYRFNLSYSSEPGSSPVFSSSQNVVGDSLPDLSPHTGVETCPATGFLEYNDTTAKLQEVMKYSSEYYFDNQDPELPNQPFRYTQPYYQQYQPHEYDMHSSSRVFDDRRCVSGGLHQSQYYSEAIPSPSPCLTSPALERPTTVTWNSPLTANGAEGTYPSSSGMQRDEEDEDSLGDKPYARLIYDALSQAPGKKMMLREIYEWFQVNTTKPQESGTNGWQNSIRHNLSMNQAFENDKADSSARCGHARKSNSVWILTEAAIRDGVQSTTRYRKSGTAKNTSTNRIPAVRRQESGAKGGRAARRAAKWRRREESEIHRQLSLSQMASSRSNYSGSDVYSNPTEADYLSTYTPTTPTDEQLFSVPVGLSTLPYSLHLQELKPDLQYTAAGESHLHDSLATPPGQSWDRHAEDPPAPPMST